MNKIEKVVQALQGLAPTGFAISLEGSTITTRKQDLYSSSTFFSENENKNIDKVLSDVQDAIIDILGEYWPTLNGKRAEIYFDHTKEGITLKIDDETTYIEIK